MATGPPLFGWVFLSNLTHLQFLYLFPLLKHIWGDIFVVQLGFEYNYNHCRVCVALTKWGQWLTNAAAQSGKSMCSPGASLLQTVSKQRLLFCVLKRQLFQKNSLCSTV